MDSEETIQESRFVSICDIKLTCFYLYTFTEIWVIKFFPLLEKNA